MPSNFLSLDSIVVRRERRSRFSLASTFFVGEAATSLCLTKNRSEGRQPRFKQGASSEIRDDEEAISRERDVKPSNNVILIYKSNLDHFQGLSLLQHDEKSFSIQSLVSHIF